MVPCALGEAGAMPIQLGVVLPSSAGSVRHAMLQPALRQPIVQEAPRTSRTASLDEPHAGSALIGTSIGWVAGQGRGQGRGQGLSAAGGTRLMDEADDSSTCPRQKKTIRDCTDVICSTQKKRSEIVLMLFAALYVYTIKIRDPRSHGRIQKNDQRSSNPHRH